MFARKLSIQLQPNKFVEFTNTLEKDVIPLLRKQQGFKDEITFGVPDKNEVLAISLWDTEKNAATYDSSTYKDVLKLLGSLIVGTPKVGTTEVVHSTFHQIHAGIAAA
jgi:heme-degrading monooxygenase HmoA